MAIRYLQGCWANPDGANPDDRGNPDGFFGEKHKMDYEDVRRGVVADPRIGESHSQVPGVDNDRGFGGTCFPKDLNALIAQFDEVGLNSKMFKEIWKYNEKIRTKIDWSVT